MPRKTFEAGAKPFEEKFRKQADAIEKVGARLDGRLDEISGVMDIMMDDLSAQERKRVYDLNTVVDISELDDTEKEYLCSILYALANLNTQLTQLQKDYLRSLKSYLKVVNVQSEVSLESIENIDNITTQKAIMQTIMEFLFLEYGNHNYMDDYEDIFDYFSVNRKGIREIQNCIDTMYGMVGLEGIAEHYGSTKKVTIIQNSSLSKAELDLQKTAESAYLKYDLKTAQTLFTLLATQGDGRSCYFLSQIYENGYKKEIPADKEQAQLFANQGAATGDLLCLLKKAEFEEELDSFCSEYYEAITSLAEQGDTFAMYELGRMYSTVLLNIQDVHKAEYWYSLAVESEFCLAQSALGDIFFAKKEYNKAFSLYQKAYAQGYNAVAGNLANCYSNGWGTTQDAQKTYELHSEAATNGIVSSQDYMAAYEQSKGNLSEAMRWYDLAIKNGSTRNHYNYAKLYFEQVRFSSGRITIPGNYTYNGAPQEISEYWLTVARNLILGANYGDERASVELIGATLPTTWWILYKQGELTSINNKFNVLDKEYSFDNYATGKDFCDAIRPWKMEILKKYANAGSGAAAYYVGMEYGHQYEIMKRATDKSEAITWLSMARRNGVQDRSVDDATKKLNAFKMFSFPYPKDFVE